MRHEAESINMTAAPSFRLLFALLKYVYIIPQYSDIYVAKFENITQQNVQSFNLLKS